MHSSDPFSSYQQSEPSNQGNSLRGTVSPSKTPRSVEKTAATDWQELSLKNPIETEPPIQITINDYMKFSQLLIKVEQLLNNKDGATVLSNADRARSETLRTKLKAKQTELEKILRTKNIPLPSPVDIMKFNPNEE